MKREELLKLDTPKLHQKLKGNKLMTGLLIGLGIVLMMASASEFYRSDFNWTTLVIALCCFAGAYSVRSEQKTMKNILAERKRDE